MVDEILIKYKVELDSIKADLKTVQTELKTTEDVGVKAGKSTSESFGKTEEKVKSLKAQLKDFKSQLEKATDPKDIERISKAAGEVRIKINEVNESVKVFSDSSKFQQIGNAFGSIASNLRSLDFARANQQSKVLVGLTKSITFKEAGAGLKDLGSTFLNIGKSLLMNPIFLIGSAISLIIANFDKLKSSGGAIGKLFTAIGDIITTVIEGINTLSNLIGLTDTKASDLYNNQIDNLQELADAHDKTSQRIIGILKAQGKETSKLERAAIQSKIKNIDDQYALLAKSVADGITTEKIGFEKAKELGDKRADLIAQDLEIYYAANTKKLADDKISNQKLIDEANNNVKILRDLITGNIAPDYDREKQQLADKLADDIQQYQKNGAIIVELKIRYINALNAIDAKQREKEQAIDQDKIKASKDKVAALTKIEEDYDDAYSKRISDNLAAEIDAMQKATDEDKKQIEQRKRFQEELGSAIVGGLQSIGQIISNINKNKLD